jgi:hypothetical protein
MLSVTAEVGIRESHALVVQFGVEPSQLVDTAYVDLLAETRTYPSVPAGLNS